MSFGEEIAVQSLQILHRLLQLSLCHERLYPALEIIVIVAHRLSRSPQLLQLLPEHRELPLVLGCELAGFHRTLRSLLDQLRRFQQIPGYSFRSLRNKTQGLALDRESRRRRLRLLSHVFHLPGQGAQQLGDLFNRFHLALKNLLQRFKPALERALSQPLRKLLRSSLDVSTGCGLVPFPCSKLHPVELTDRLVPHTVTDKDPVVDRRTRRKPVRSRVDGRQDPTTRPHFSVLFYPPNLIQILRQEAGLDPHRLDAVVIESADDQRHRLQPVERDRLARPLDPDRRRLVLDGHHPHRLHRQTGKTHGVIERR